jgi:hypothetical protein
LAGRAVNPVASALNISEPRYAVEWRERPHDDLVPAVAVAAWQGERGPGFAVVVCAAPVPERARRPFLVGW